MDYIDHELASDLSERILKGEFNIPSVTEYKIIDYVIEHLKGFDLSFEKDYRMSFLPVETFKTIKSFRQLYGTKTAYLAKYILNQLDICAESGKNEYVSHYKDGMIFTRISVPKRLDSTANIYLGHELIHVMKENANKEEIASRFTYLEILPILHELFMSDIASNKKSFIIGDRIMSLKASSLLLDKIQNSNSFKDYNLFRYILLTNYAYFLSYYYAILLSDLKNKYPDEVLSSVSEVLLQDKSTKDVLERFELLDTFDKNRFEEIESRLIKKCF